MVGGWKMKKSNTLSMTAGAIIIGSSTRLAAKLL